MKNRITIFALALEAFAAHARANSVQINNGYSAQDTTIYLNVDLKGKGGGLQLVDSNTKKIDGTTNLDGNKLSPGRYYVIDGVRLLAENTQTTFGAAAWKDEAIAAVKNSTLVISQGEEIFRIPVIDIHNDNASTGNDNDFREIGHLPIIGPDKEFKLEWTFPSGVSVSGSVTACLARLEFRVTEVFLK